MKNFKIFDERVFSSRKADKAGSSKHWQGQSTLLIETRPFEMAGGTWMSRMFPSALLKGPQGNSRSHGWRA